MQLLHPMIFSLTQTVRVAVATMIEIQAFGHDYIGLLDFMLNGYSTIVRNMKNYLLLLFVILAMNANGAIIVDSLYAMSTRANVYRRAAQAFYTTYESWVITDVAIIGIGISPDIEISIFSSDYTKPLSKIATLYRGSAENAGFNRLTTNRTPTDFTFSPVELSPQNPYWIVVENLNYTGADSLMWGSTTSNSTSFGDGFRTSARDSLSQNSWGTASPNPYVMKVTAIPEPNHFMMLGFGALIILRRSRASRFGCSPK